MPICRVQTTFEAADDRSEMVSGYYSTGQTHRLEELET